MKILIMSDTHGMNKWALDAIRREKADMLIHCGDVEGYERDLSEAAGSPRTPCVFVKGNNDWTSGYPLTTTFSLKGHRFLVTHGHTQGVYAGPIGLRMSAQENGCDIVIYGHTHMPHDEEIQGVRFLNPGSISIPRGGSKKSYMIMELSEDGSYIVELKSV